LILLRDKPTEKYTATVEVDHVKGSTVSKQKLSSRDSECGYDGLGKKFPGRKREGPTEGKKFGPKSGLRGLCRHNPWERKSLDYTFRQGVWETGP